MENSKPLALVLFFGAFCGIVLYVFTGKRRSQRLESYKYMPFEDDDLRQLNISQGEAPSQFHKVKDDERQ
ncbi:MAG: CcoQ/FixQ family Cbb3-type cytochrome c oxidase assembly chaperone [Candidatus Contendobacter odensis]|uniref:CcoQ/FixQ family Cbb3-type cytochrome c oxidase assembly chaperone n=1 Tax=Candidatus Contendibacter odensensis TaxID=1400860 RepID=A0A2G6PED5_9GAMM|nr:MAG: CcoQ/FixQ family Cbb3-type cytochrome c oxidase assembly chaperone [Candidatus Contendobacter odensis]